MRKLRNYNRWVMLPNWLIVLTRKQSLPLSPSMFVCIHFLDLLHFHCLVAKLEVVFMSYRYRQMLGFNVVCCVLQFLGRPLPTVHCCLVVLFYWTSVEDRKGQLGRHNVQVISRSILDYS